jgi:hypothetical protein
MPPEVMVRTYGGNNQRHATLLYAEDAPMLAAARIAAWRTAAVRDRRIGMILVR